MAGFDIKRQAVSEDGTRNVAAERPFSWKHFFLKWEWLLVVLLIAVNVICMSLSSNYGEFDNIMSALRNFMDKAIIVFPMAFVIMLGEIDISVASTMALSAVLMGVASRAGVPLWAAILIALATGAVCGFINGIILAKFNELSSMIVTLATQIIYRGIASIILETQSVSFPVEGWFNKLGWGSVGPFPIAVLFVVVEIIFFTYLMHCTKFGRRTRAMGNSVTVSRFSGIKTNYIKVIVFTMVGLMSAVAAIFLASKMGSVRPNMAKGYELDIIAMVVLGGISTSGGKGNMIGAVIATLIIGLLRYGLGLINVQSQVVMIIIGALLIVTVAVPNMKNLTRSVKLFNKKSKERR